MTQQDIWEKAVLQSAIDIGGTPALFTEKQGTILSYSTTMNRRVYMSSTMEGYLVSYGKAPVGMGKNEAKSILEQYIYGRTSRECFSFPGLSQLSYALQKKGLAIEEVNQYFLPVVDKIPNEPFPFPLSWYGKKELSFLYQEKWPNALCEMRKERDEIAVGILEGHQRIALAGASSDCASMWQIGVDVRSPYQGKKMGKTLTIALTRELLKRDIIPFYSCNLGHIASYKTALASGYTPAWMELVVEKSSIEK